MQMPYKLRQLQGKGESNVKRLLGLIVLLASIGAAQAQNSVNFAWDLSSDDSTLGVGGGYHLYQSKLSGNYTTPVATYPPGATTGSIQRPGPGRYYWVLTAFTSDAIESSYSNEVTLVIKPNPPKLNTVQQAMETVKKGLTYLAGLFKGGGKQQLRIVS